MAGRRLLTVLPNEVSSIPVAYSPPEIVFLLFSIETLACCDVCRCRLAVRRVIE
jgi:hypothetical protein